MYHGKTRKQEMKSIKKGYSLIELSIVVLMISMISSLVVPVSKHNNVSDAVKVEAAQIK